MALDQIAFRGRSDSVALSDDSFAFAPLTNWTQKPGVPFRVRFVIEGSGTVGGQLEFSDGGTVYTNVTSTSGTVQASRSRQFPDGASISSLLSDPAGFIGGAADSQNGAVDPIELDDEHTEIEYCALLIPQHVSSGGTINLRVAGLDSYPQSPSLSITFSELDRVRLLVGDTDVADLLLSDAEIESKISNWPGNVDLAAADAAEAIAAKFSRGFNFSTDGQSFNRRERVLHYMDLSQRLRSRGGALVWPSS